MRHRTLFLHIAILVALSVITGAAAAMPSPSVDHTLLLLDRQPVNPFGAIAVSVPGPGLLAVSVHDEGAAMPPWAWIEIMAQPGSGAAAGIGTLLRDVDRQVAWVEGPATYELWFGSIDLSRATNQPRFVTARFVAMGPGGVTKDGDDGDGGDTGEADNEILPNGNDDDGGDTGEADNEILPATKDGGDDGGDTGEADNEILPSANEGDDGGDTGEADNEILPLSGATVAGQMDNDHPMTVPQPSSVLIGVAAQGAATVTVLDASATVVASHAVAANGTPTTFTMVLPSGNYRVRLDSQNGGAHAYVVSALATVLPGPFHPSTQP